jgi:hypothetical protein
MVMPLNKMFHPDMKDAIARVGDARKRVAAILYLASKGYTKPGDRLMMEDASTAELVKVTQDARDGKFY